MRILAFDTSSTWCSVALQDGARLHVAEEPLGQAHSERLLPMANGLLAAAGRTMRDLDAIAFGAGPGSFTGVRIACSVAQGLALGLDVPAIGIGTLEALAHEASYEHGLTRVLACIDARMGQVYVGAYEREGTTWRELRAPAVLSPQEVSAPGTESTGAGNGFAAYPKLAAQIGLARVLPDVRATARAIADLATTRLASGERGAPEDAQPLYVRHRIALTTAEREAGLRL